MVKLMSVMSGLIGWTLSLGVGALIILAIAAASSFVIISLEVLSSSKAILRCEILILTSSRAASLTVAS